jgi:hypothetical protein
MKKEGMKRIAQQKKKEKAQQKIDYGKFAQRIKEEERRREIINNSNIASLDNSKKKINAVGKEQLLKAQRRSNSLRVQRRNK